MCRKIAVRMVKSRAGKAEKERTVAAEEDRVGSAAPGPEEYVAFREVTRTDSQKLQHKGALCSFGCSAGRLGRFSCSGCWRFVALRLRDISMPLFASIPFQEFGFTLYWCLYQYKSATTPVAIPDPSVSDLRSGERQRSPQREPRPQAIRVRLPLGKRLAADIGSRQGQG